MKFLGIQIGGEQKAASRAEPSLFRDFAAGTNLSASGLYIGPENAMRNMTTLSCIRVLSESVAMLPCHVTRNLNGVKQSASETRIYTVLKDRPNEYQTSFQFYETIMQHLLLRGNFYGYITRNADGRIQEILPIHPDNVEVKLFEDWSTEYSVKLGKGGKQIVPRNRILHIAGLQKPGEVCGQSVISYARDAIGFAAAAERHGNKFFANGARPGSILKHPGQMSADAIERLRGQFEELHAGVNNHFRTMILEEGMGFEPVTMTMQDAQFLEIRKFQRLEICAAFRVPPHKVADLERATFSNIEQQSIEFVADSLMPWIRRIETALERDLLLDSVKTPTGTINEKAAFQIRFNVSALLRGDTTQRYQAYAIGRQWGWLSVNDIRALEDMNPVSGGDTYLSPMNMVPADQLGKMSESDKKAAELLERLSKDD